MDIPPTRDLAAGFGTWDSRAVRWKNGRFLEVKMVFRVLVLEKCRLSWFGSLVWFENVLFGRLVWLGKMAIMFPLLSQRTQAEHCWSRIWKKSGTY